MKIEISIPKQQLVLKDDRGKVVKTYLVSTATRGAGEVNGSLQTPRGRHIVRAKIGAGQPLNTVFVRRRPTGEVWSPELHGKFPGRDWILTRILWLSGCEPGKNRLGDVDTRINTQEYPAFRQFCAQLERTFRNEIVVGLAR